MVSLATPVKMLWLRQCVCRREMRRSWGESAAVGAPVRHPEPPTVSHHQVRAAACFTSGSPIKTVCSVDRTGARSSAAVFLRRNAKFSSSESDMWRRADICGRLRPQGCQGITKVFVTVRRCSSVRCTFMQFPLSKNVTSPMIVCTQYIFGIALACIRLLFTAHYGILWLCWKGYDGLRCTGPQNGELPSCCVLFRKLGSNSADISQSEMTPRLLIKDVRGPRNQQNQELCASYFEFPAMS